MPRQRIVIAGDGGWGTALALVLLDNGHAVTLWSAFADAAAETARTRENRLYLPGVRLPDALRITADAAEAADQADVLVLAAPSRFFPAVARTFSGVLAPSARVISVAKGIDDSTLQRMTQVAERVLGTRPVAALSGPSLAAEVARRLPTAVVVASPEPGQSRFFQALFSNARFRVYTSDDVAGIEYGGAFKNIVALAVGASDGLGFGDNTRAALMTRGLAEITRLGVALGARAETFAGLSGAGDLIVTCSSRQSRNHTVGERLGRGESIETILGGMKQVAEGVWNSAAARTLARRHGVSVPIIDQVCAVLQEGRPPRKAVESLMTREVKPELADRP